MNPIVLFSALMLLAAVAMLRVSDRKQVFVLGVASLLVLIPSGLFMTESLNWRTNLMHNPTPVGYGLITLVGVGSIFAIACMLSAVLRVLIAAVRGLRLKKQQND